MTLSHKSTSTKMRGANGVHVKRGARLELWPKRPCLLDHIVWIRPVAWAFLLTMLASGPASAQDCRTIAAAPPLVTFGGPATIAPGNSEVALEGATDGTLFDCTHKPDLGWFVGWRRGLTDRLDLGTDFLTVQHNNESTAIAKIAARYRVRNRLRLEMGFGGADDSEGKSLNADLGVTTGTLRDGPRNYFASMRVAGARGYPGSVCCFGGGGNNTPPDNYRLVGSFGSTMRISDNTALVYEFGFGGVLAHFSDRSDIGRIVSFHVGLVFDFRKNHTSTAAGSQGANH